MNTRRLCLLIFAGIMLVGSLILSVPSAAQVQPIGLLEVPRQDAYREIRSTIERYSPAASPLNETAAITYYTFLPFIGYSLVPTYTISGLVTSTIGSLAGVTISTQTGVTTTTGASGTYTFTYLIAGTYTLTASKAGYAFSAPRVVTVPPSQINQNFTATPLTYTVSGRVLDGANPVAGVLVSAGASYTSTTGSNGNYSLAGLLAGSYTITATKLGFVFTSRNVSVPPSRTGQDLQRLSTTVAWPTGMVSDSTRNHLFVADSLDNASVSVFTESAGALTPLTKIPLTSSPAFGIGLMNDYVYVSNWGTSSTPSSVSVISASTLLKVKDIQIGACGGHASHLAVNPVTGHIFVPLHSGNRVAVIDTLNSDQVTCVTTNAAPFGVAFHPASNSIFVGNRDGLDLWRIIDSAPYYTATQIVDWRSGSGGSPYYVGVDPDRSKLLAMVGLPDAGIPDKLYAYDIGVTGVLTQVLSPVTVGNTSDGGYVLQSRSQCSVAPGLVYVAATATNEIWVLNSDLSTRRRLSVSDGIGDGPYSLTENPTLKQIYVANKRSGAINILNACDGSLLK